MRMTAQAQIDYQACMLENISDAVIVTDKDFAVTVWNRAAEELFCRNAEEALGRDGRDFLPADIVGMKGAAADNAGARGSVAEETVVNRRGGQVVHVESRTVVIRNPKGDAAGYLHVLRDTGARGREERLSRIIEVIPDGIVMVNREGRITFANPVAEKTLGLTRDSIVERVYNDPGWKITAVDGGPFAEKDLPFVQVMRSGKPVYGVEHAIELPDGRRVALSINAAPFHDTQGNLLGMVAAFSDITGRKKTEDLLTGEKQALEMIALREPLPRILEKITRNIEGQSNGLIGSILLMDEDGAHLRHGAAPNLPEAYNRAIDGGAIGPAAGSCGTAAYRKAQVIVSDIAADPLWVDYRELALKNGLRACWSTPILSTNGDVLGTFAMYYGRPRQPAPSDMKLIERATYLASIAINSIRTEEKLKKSEALLKEVQHLATMGGWEYDVERKKITWTEEVYRIHDLSSDVYDPNNISQDIDFYEPDDRRTIEQAFFRAVNQGEPYDLELRLVTARGRHLWVRTVGRPELKDGRTAKVVGNILDITERKRSEESLRRNERVLRLFVEYAPAAIAMLDRDMKYIVASRRYLMDYDLGEQDLVGRSHYEVFPEIPERWKDIHMRCLAGAVERADADPFPRKDGRMDWVRWEIHPWEERPGEIGGIILFSEVITERKLAEEALAESQRRLVTLIGNLPGAAYRCRNDEDWSTDFASEGMLDLTGYPASDFKEQRRNVGQLIHPDDRSRVWNEIQAAIHDRRPFKITYRIVTATGSEKWVWEQGCGVFDANGALLWLEGFVTDITALKRAEDEIRALNIQLEQRVRERTAQLESANKELESFAYSVSHDLRAPLRAVGGFAEIIASRHRADLNEEGRHYVDNIVQASERMGHLIDDLLRYSRMGRQVVRREPVPLNDIFAPLARDLDARMKETGGTLEIADDLPTVPGDRTLLSQIFTNLLENAITYCKPGVPAKITVTCRIDGNAAIIRISDNGIGIPPEYHEKIFNVFQRLHSEEEYPGTGIGLAIVRKSVDLLGGNVWVESEAGRGSVFVVRLPRE